MLKPQLMFQWWKHHLSCQRRLKLVGVFFVTASNKIDFQWLPAIKELESSSDQIRPDLEIFNVPLMFRGLRTWWDICMKKQLCCLWASSFLKGHLFWMYCSLPFRENGEKQGDPRSMCMDCAITKVSYNSFGISVFGQKALETMKFESADFF